MDDVHSKDIIDHTTRNLLVAVITFCSGIAGQQLSIVMSATESATERFCGLQC